MIPQVDARLRVLLIALILVIVLLLAALVGCGVSPSPAFTVTPQSPAPAPPSTPPTSTTPIAISTPTESVPSQIALTVWGPERFAPGEENDGRETLQAQYQSFRTENEDLELEYVIKAPYGEGGLLHFLLTAGYAAPDVLPDLVIVDAFELGPLAQAGLAQPLQDLLTEELKEDLFPFAEEACTFDGEQLGVQFEADIEHLIYHTPTLEAPPVTWADLFTDTVAYIFPARGQSGLVNDAFLIQYLAQGGQLVGEEGTPNLESSPMVRVLRLYEEGTRYDVIPSKVQQLGSLEECWETYAEGNITVSHISSWRYLSSRSLMQDTTFAALPTETGDTATMTRGWAFAIITSDPRRQAAAARLIEWLMDSQNLAAQSLATNHLPTRASALPLTGWPEDYADFLASQLETAFFRPSTPEFDRIARALQGAVEDVLGDQRTPRQAAAVVIDSLQ